MHLQVLGVRHGRLCVRILPREVLQHPRRLALIVAQPGQHGAASTLSANACVKKHG